MIKTKKKKEKVKKFLKFIGIILLFIVLIYFLEGWGVLGVLIFILGIVAIRCWKQKGFLKLMMRQIEMTIFGKPLDKDMWDKGEMKNTRIKVVWNSKSKVDWNKYITILVYPALILLFIGVIWDVTSVTVISVVFFSVIIIVKLIYYIGRLIKNVQSKEKNEA